MKIAIAQINTMVGDFEGNKKKILHFLEKAEDMDSDIVVFSELTICGYSPRDLLDKRVFIEENLSAVNDIAVKTRSTAVAIGHVGFNQSKTGRALFNQASLLYEGKIRFSQAKTLLPEYDVFDEKRYFEPATVHDVHNFKGLNVGLSLCEDLWSQHEFGDRKLYIQDPLAILAQNGVQVLLNLSASPFAIGKDLIRKQLVGNAARKFSIPLFYSNMVGGNDELVFDGRSSVADNQGNIIAEGKAFQEDLFLVDLDKTSKALKLENMEDEEDVLGALVLGLRDYMRKCSFKKVVVGLSGGIDSALVVAIASIAVGPENVMAITLSSPYTSKQSIEDAYKVAENCKISVQTISINDAFHAYQDVIQTIKEDKSAELALENIQARIRGNILMAYSNINGALVLSTGNKSELSVGYCTLYGDMAGGLAIISDLPKTMVYRLSNYINKKKKFIPDSVINKAPTAELKPNQTDQDVLPPYEILDEILKEYVENHTSFETIVAKGFDGSVVKDVLRRVNLNEYKRRQSPPGLKVTSKAFGSGRRFPIAWKG